MQCQSYYVIPWQTLLVSRVTQSCVFLSGIKCQPNILSQTCLIPMVAASSSPFFISFRGLIILRHTAIHFLKQNQKHKAAENKRKHAKVKALPERRWSTWLPVLGANSWSFGINAIDGTWRSALGHLRCPSLRKSPQAQGIEFLWGVKNTESINSSWLTSSS